MADSNTFDVSQIGPAARPPKKGDKAHANWGDALKTVIIELPAETPNLSTALKRLFDQPVHSYAPGIASAPGGITDGDRRLLETFYLTKKCEGKSIEEVAKEWDRNHQVLGDFEFRVIPKLEALVRETKDRKEANQRLAVRYKDFPGERKVTLACKHDVIYEAVGIIDTACPFGCGRQPTSDKLRELVLKIAKEERSKQQ
jgi:hypothetical protein